MEQHYYLNKKLDSLQNENWVKIPDYKGYFISNLGRVKSIHEFLNGTTIVKIRTQTVSHNGYLRLQLHNTKRKHFFVHRLVAEYFIGERKGRFVNHKNGIKTDNRVENLEWVTCKENTAHGFFTGLITNICDKHPMAKLNSKKVSEIFLSKESGAVLAKKYNISSTNICDIRKGRIWKPITDLLR